MKNIAGALLAASLCLAGCGGMEAEPNSSEPANQSVLTGVQCTNKQWRDIFWSSAAHTTQVGVMVCPCFGPQTLTGVESNFVTLAFENTCSLQ